MPRFDPSFTRPTTPRDILRERRIKPLTLLDPTSLDTPDYMNKDLFFDTAKIEKLFLSPAENADFFDMMFGVDVSYEFCEHIIISTYYGRPYFEFDCYCDYDEGSLSLDSCYIFLQEHHIIEWLRYTIYQHAGIENEMYNEAKSSDPDIRSFIRGTPPWNFTPDTLLLVKEVTISMFEYLSEEKDKAKKNSQK